METLEIPSGLIYNIRNPEFKIIKKNGGTVLGSNYIVFEIGRSFKLASGGSQPGTYIIDTDCGQKTINLMNLLKDLSENFRISEFENIVFV
jgi:hypothetical protein